MPLLYDMDSGPVEIARGRGDLRYSSTIVPYGGDQRRTISTVGGTVSYAQVFATQPWIAAAVMRMLTMAIRVPLKVYKRTGDDSRERLTPEQHPLAAAVVAPWEGGSQAELIQALLGPLLVHGNGVTEVRQGRSDKITFDPIDWRFVVPIYAIASAISGWTITEDNAEREIGADSAVHLAWWSALGPLGISPLQQLNVTLKVEDAAQRYQSALFANGARPPSAI